MKEILLRELFRNTAEYQDKEVLIKGWVRNNRNSNKFGFIELNDGSFFKSVQVVYEEEFIDNFEAYLCVAMLIIMSIVVFVQVIFRFVLKSSLPWSEELCRYLLTSYKIYEIFLFLFQYLAAFFAKSLDLGILALKILIDKAYECCEPKPHCRRIYLLRTVIKNKLSRSHKLRISFH